MTRFLSSEGTESASPGAASHGFVFASAAGSGQVGATVADETRDCVERIVSTLASAGRSLAGIVKANLWVSDDALVDEAVAAYRAALGPDCHPVRSVLVAGVPGDGRVAVDVVAAQPDAVDAPFTYASSLAIDVATMRRVPEASTITGETAVVFQRIGKQLEAAGLGVQDIVKTTTYVRDESYLEEFERAYREIFAPQQLPARCTVLLGLAGDCRIQIEATAAAA
ncbi:RidA family protein [Amycolatopsis sp. Poz14]|uniref:RidA family protein n=1 Tax=Amycolatopsis sp. Poz14 TaxID=1447705 RepID=UPI001EE8470C|nr:RidA family protein [Amycolatopsis sp. Poz14]MCG3754056.1 RidA family protein [Amycolatopsis sp. Poz14]